MTKTNKSPPKVPQYTVISQGYKCLYKKELNEVTYLSNHYLFLNFHLCHGHHVFTLAFSLLCTFVPNNSYQIAVILFEGGLVCTTWKLILQHGLKQSTTVYRCFSRKLILVFYKLFMEIPPNRKWIVLFRINVFVP